ncbi:transmembrane protein, putative (macronuclear) [Tetrahymena thermophila SB210]|uniref:Transmembrane protein, putative n=1 Tax=Tetrahymena thermophila (strain SB210) TaxID=312017 RepID=W7X3I7_TETTS|nr:transmembrane protein, putative [Tetrahymena thermophila SB210]EWS72027.1 transmembrane protein, putative [Tetrahymena thermophila SB210]|eukprot:XP_012655434.1 transmembrane protein, putative [Tetrahymena thermophila SB210]
MHIQWFVLSFTLLLEKQSIAQNLRKYQNCSEYRQLLKKLFIVLLFSFLFLVKFFSSFLMIFRSFYFQSRHSTTTSSPLSRIYFKNEDRIFLFTLFLSNFSQRDSRYSSSYSVNYFQNREDESQILLTKFYFVSFESQDTSLSQFQFEKSSYCQFSVHYYCQKFALIISFKETSLSDDFFSQKSQRLSHNLFVYYMQLQEIKSWSEGIHSFEFGEELLFEQNEFCLLITLIFKSCYLQVNL